MARRGQHPGRHHADCLRLDVHAALGILLHLAHRRLDHFDARPGRDADHGSHHAPAQIYQVAGRGRLLRAGGGCGAALRPRLRAHARQPRLRQCAGARRGGGDRHQYGHYQTPARTAGNAGRDGMVLHRRAGRDGAVLLEIHRPYAIPAPAVAGTGRTGLHPDPGDGVADVPALPGHRETDFGAYGPVPLYPARHRRHPGPRPRAGGVRCRQYRGAGLHLRGGRPGGDRV